MFLHHGTLVQLNADGSESALFTAQQHQKSLTIGSSYQADVVLNETLSAAEAASGTTSSIYCEITADAFGRISISNSGAAKLLVNGVAIQKTRPLQAASQIEIGAHKFRWDCSANNARPVTPTDLASKDAQRAVDIHKTVSYSEPTRNVRAKKIIRKAKKQANQNGRFTIFTRCPESMGANSSCNSDENSMNETNSAAEEEEQKQLLNDSRDAQGDSDDEDLLLQLDTSSVNAVEKPTPAVDDVTTAAPADLTAGHDDLLSADDRLVLQSDDEDETESPMNISKCQPDSVVDVQAAEADKTLVVVEVVQHPHEIDSTKLEIPVDETVPDELFAEDKPLAEIDEKTADETLVTVTTNRVPDVSMKDAVAYDKMLTTPDVVELSNTENGAEQVVADEPTEPLLSTDSLTAEDLVELNESLTEDLSVPNDARTSNTSDSVTEGDDSKNVTEQQQSIDADGIESPPTEPPAKLSTTVNAVKQPFVADKYTGAPSAVQFALSAATTEPDEIVHSGAGAQSIDAAQEDIVPQALLSVEQNDESNIDVVVVESEVPHPVEFGSECIPTDNKQEKNESLIESPTESANIELDEPIEIAVGQVESSAAVKTSVEAQPIESPTPVESLVESIDVADVQVEFCAAVDTPVDAQPTESPAPNESPIESIEVADGQAESSAAVDSSVDAEPTATPAPVESLVESIKVTDGQAESSAAVNTPIEVTDGQADSSAAVDTPVDAQPTESPAPNESPIESIEVADGQAESSAAVDSSVDATSTATPAPVESLVESIKVTDGQAESSAAVNTPVDAQPTESPALFGSLVESIEVGDGQDESNPAVDNQADAQPSVTAIPFESENAIESAEPRPFEKSDLSGGCSADSESPEESIQAAGKPAELSAVVDNQAEVQQSSSVAPIKLNNTIESVGTETFDIEPQTQITTEINMDTVVDKESTVQQVLPSTPRTPSAILIAPAQYESDHAVESVEELQTPVKDSPGNVFADIEPAGNESPGASIPAPDVPATALPTASATSVESVEVVESIENAQSVEVEEDIRVAIEYVEEPQTPVEDVPGCVSADLELAEPDSTGASSLATDEPATALLTASPTPVESVAVVESIESAQSVEEDPAGDKSADIDLHAESSSTEADIKAVVEETEQSIVLLAQQTPARRRSKRLSVDTVNVPETPLAIGHLNVIAESFGHRVVGAQTPTRRGRSARNSIDQKLGDTPSANTPKQRRGGLLGKGKLLSAADSPSLKAVAETVAGAAELLSLTPRRRSVRKLADAQTPQIDHELKRKLELIIDSPDGVVDVSPITKIVATAAVDVRTPSRRRLVRKSVDLAGMSELMATPKAPTVGCPTIGTIAAIKTVDEMPTTPSRRRLLRKSVDLSGIGELVQSPQITRVAAAMALTKVSEEKSNSVDVTPAKSSVVEKSTIELVTSETVTSAEVPDNQTTADADVEAIESFRKLVHLSDAHVEKDENAQTDVEELTIIKSNKSDKSAIAETIIETATFDSVENANGDDQFAEDPADADKTSAKTPARQRQGRKSVNLNDINDLMQTPQIVKADAHSEEDENTQTDQSFTTESNIEPIISDSVVNAKDAGQLADVDMTSSKTPSRQRRGRKSVDLTCISDLMQTPQIAKTVVHVEVANPADAADADVDNTSSKTPSRQRRGRDSLDLAGISDLMQSPQIVKNVNTDAKSLESVGEENALLDKTIPSMDFIVSSNISAKAIEPAETTPADSAKSESESAVNQGSLCDVAEEKAQCTIDPSPDSSDTSDPIDDAIETNSTTQVTITDSDLELDLDPTGSSSQADTVSLPLDELSLDSDELRVIAGVVSIDDDNNVVLSETNETSTMQQQPDTTDVGCSHPNRTQSPLPPLSTATTTTPTHPTMSATCSTQQSPEADASDSGDLVEQLQSDTSVAVASTTASSKNNDVAVNDDDDDNNKGAGVELQTLASSVVFAEEVETVVHDAESDKGQTAAVHIEENADNAVSVSVVLDTVAVSDSVSMDGDDMLQMTNSGTETTKAVQSDIDMHSASVGISATLPALRKDNGDDKMGDTCFSAALGRSDEERTDEVIMHDAVDVVCDAIARPAEVVDNDIVKTGGISHQEVLFAKSENTRSDLIEDDDKVQLVPALSENNTSDPIDDNSVKTDVQLMAVLPETAIQDPANGGAVTKDAQTQLVSTLSENTSSVPVDALSETVNSEPEDVTILTTDNNVELVPTCSETAKSDPIDDDIVTTDDNVRLVAAVSEKVSSVPDTADDSGAASEHVHADAVASNSVVVTQSTSDKAVDKQTEAVTANGSDRPDDIANASPDTKFELGGEDDISVKCPPTNESPALDMELHDSDENCEPATADMSASLVEADIQLVTNTCDAFTVSSASKSDSILMSPPSPVSANLDTSASPVSSGLDSSASPMGLSLDNTETLFSPLAKEDSTVEVELAVGVVTVKTEVASFVADEISQAEDNSPDIACGAVKTEQDVNSTANSIDDVAGPHANEPDAGTIDIVPEPPITSAVPEMDKSTPIVDEIKHEDHAETDMFAEDTPNTSIVVSALADQAVALVVELSPTTAPVVPVATARRSTRRSVSPVREATAAKAACSSLNSVAKTATAAEPSTERSRRSVSKRLSIDMSPSTTRSRRSASIRQSTESTAPIEDTVEPSIARRRSASKRLSIEITVESSVSPSAKKPRTQPLLAVDSAAIIEVTSLPGTRRTRQKSACQTPSGLAVTKQTRGRPRKSEESQTVANIVVQSGVVADAEPPTKASRGRRIDKDEPIDIEAAELTSNTIEQKRVEVAEPKIETKASRGRRAKKVEQGEIQTAPTIAEKKAQSTSSETVKAEKTMTVATIESKSVAASHDAKPPAKASRGRTVKKDASMDTEAAVGTTLQTAATLDPQIVERPVKASRGRQVKIDKSVQPEAAVEPAQEVESKVSAPSEPPAKVTRGRRAKKDTSVEPEATVELVQEVESIVSSSAESPTKASRGRRAKKDTSVEPTVAVEQAPEVKLKVTRGRRAKKDTSVEPEAAIEPAAATADAQPARVRSTRKASVYVSPVKEPDTEPTRGRSRKASTYVELVIEDKPNTRTADRTRQPSVCKSPVRDDPGQVAEVSAESALVSPAKSTTSARGRVRKTSPVHEEETASTEADDEITKTTAKKTTRGKRGNAEPAAASMSLTPIREAIADKSAVHQDIAVVATKPIDAVGRKRPAAAVVASEPAASPPKRSARGRRQAAPEPTDVLPSAIASPVVAVQQSESDATQQANVKAKPSRKRGADLTAVTTVTTSTPKRAARGRGRAAAVETEPAEPADTSSAAASVDEPESAVMQTKPGRKRTADAVTVANTPKRAARGRGRTAVAAESLSQPGAALVDDLETVDSTVEQTETAANMEPTTAVAKATGRGRGGTLKATAAADPDQSDTAATNPTVKTRATRATRANNI